MRQFLLQMAGDSGTGKSTLALSIGRATGAVVLDKDVVQTALLEDGSTSANGRPPNGWSACARTTSGVHP